MPWTPIRETVSAPRRPPSAGAPCAPPSKRPTLRRGTTTCEGPNGGGICVTGGATLILDEVTIQGSTASLGAGLFANGAMVTVTDSTVAGNTAADSGGGIFVTKGSLTLQKSTVAHNT